ncbi:MAG: carbohydrate kinase [Pseudomonadota bacterium]|nr:carbohydrate kinase [Pseudomonadota bacterium]
MEITQENQLAISCETQSARNVILFGEAVIDVFPEKNIPGGAPFNVARHLRAFGLNPILITRTGNDRARHILLNDMEKFQMDTRGIQCDTRHPTGRVIIQEEIHQHQFEILPNQAYDYIHAGLARLVSLSAHPDILYFGTLAQRTKTSRRALNLLLNSISSPKMLDVNLRKPWIDASTLHRALHQADILKINDEELTVTAKLLHMDSEGIIDRAFQLMQRYPLQQIIVTCGQEGAWLLNQDGTECHVDPVHLHNPLMDTIGAGDGFSAVFILGLLNHWPVPLSLSRANDFAAELCCIRGAIPQDDKFYQPFRKKWGLVVEK